MDMMNKMEAELAAKKEAVIAKLFFQYLGHELDLIAESKRRFPRITKVINEGVDRVEESWFWNDGTYDGKRIVTFFIDKSYLFAGETFELMQKIKYY
jgi:hypothetical protein